ncbi:MAG: SIMPL domain-containing protein [Actinobacteria bacterium]|nr:SIMPL domain-containing protein [Actinomycetota bacterium]MBL7124098.1 SIMPL domain-containing protein [Actinomycetota bacterium]
MSKENSNKIIYFAIILGICLIISASIGSFTFYKVRSPEDTLSVTGSVREKVTSDLAKWTANFSRTVSAEDLKAGYQMMKNDQRLVLNFFEDNGFNEEDITISPVFMEQLYMYDPNAPKENVLRQTVEIQSNDVEKITYMAKNTQKLIDQGVVFSIQSLEYYYSKLPELRIELIPDAINDAKLRAQKIAEGSGKKIGVIKSANLGVVQVLPVNSTEVSDWGTYDTSTIEKEVMIPVTVIFTLK